jgi:signal transduction histidine kinase/CheY-like chemotaxis protein
MHNGNSQIHEINRQLDLIRGERWGRILTSVFSLMLTTIYLPLWIVALCIIGNVTSDVLGMRYMRALSPKRHVKRYHIVTALSFLREVFYALGASLTWMQAESYGQALAVGMLMAQILQLAVARASHLRFGYAGMLGILLPIIICNTYYWLRIDTNLVGLGLSSFAIGCAVSYGLVAMNSNIRLHKASAADRATALANTKAKSRFLAQMSHELRTPLNAILGMGHAELRRNKDALSQCRLSVLIAAAEGLSTILDDILDMSAVEVGRLPIRPKAVFPSSEILTTLDLFQPGIDAAGLKLTSDIDAGLEVAMQLDPQRLRQCLSNLLSNALKNTVRGGINITARLTQNPRGHGMLCIEVADTGPGVPQDLRQAIFEPFAQTHPTGAGVQGNGLGLSICRSMARQMGGDLVIAENAPNKTGAHFILTLSVAPAAPADPPLPVSQPVAATATGPVPPDPGSSSKQTSSITSGLQVLVVDDIATNRLVASTYLRMLGATMIEAASGEQALKILINVVPDLILLDMNMPGMNGMQTLEKIRALPGKAGRTPIIAMTANAMEEHRNLYLSSGVDGYLAKPINPTRIEVEINAVLHKGAAKPSG